MAWPSACRDVATKFAAQTVLGAAKSGLGNRRASVLKDAVTESGGTTIDGLHGKGNVRGASCAVRAPRNGEIEELRGRDESQYETGQAANQAADYLGHSRTLCQITIQPLTVASMSHRRP